MAREIIIRSFQSIEDFRACEALQQAVWRFPDREIVPLNELMGVQRSNGLLLAAMLGRRMVGFLFGIHGLVPPLRRPAGNRVFHVSRMLAVDREFQAQGIGLHLKAAQRHWCLERKINRACWTFDPLQAGNAHFNVAKLGVTSATYLVNVYGQSNSVLNRGLPTDRLQVDWQMESPRVAARMGDLPGRAAAPFPKYGEVEFANACRRDATGDLIPGTRHRYSGAHRVAVEIPAGITELMARRLDLARRWRLHLRRLLMDCFHHDYRIVDFVCIPHAGRDALAYVLER